MAVIFALSTVLSTFAGGVFALRNRDRLHLILGLTAGVLLGLVAFDLLPEIFALSDGSQLLGVPAVMLTFAAGFLALHLVERTMALHAGHEEHYGDHHHPQIGLASAVALATHSFLDGVAIGLAFQASSAVGVTVAIAVIAHDFADGLNTVGVMSAHGNNRRRTVGMLVADSLAPAVGALSTLWFSLPHPVLALYLGFFAGFLLYLATADILPEAHSRHPSRLTLVCTLAGVGLMWTVVGLS
ncbi:MAG: permease [Pseudonocardiales bacterium]|nr:MAG: permease [Pseudonocardiales bacterium]